MADVDARGFNDELLTLAAYVDGSVTAVIRKACIDLFASITDMTPVDTGRAKGSWGITIWGDVEDPGLPPEPDGYSANEIVSIINTEIDEFRAEILGDTVTIYNNLEYIDKLEDGSSQQAPAGMVAVSLTRFEAFFQAAIAELAGDIT